MIEIGSPMAIAASKEDADDLSAKLSRSARKLIELGTDEAPLIGFATIAIFGDGGYSLGYQMPENHPFLGPTLFVAMLKEIIERDMTGALAADDYAREHLL